MQVSIDMVSITSVFIVVGINVFTKVITKVGNPDGFMLCADVNIVVGIRVWMSVLTNIVV